MASVTYGKCNYGKNVMANEAEHIILHSLFSHHVYPRTPFQGPNVDLINTIIQLTKFNFQRE